MDKTPVTLTRHIIEEQAGEAATTAEFAAIMAQFALAAKMIARDMSHAGLIDLLGMIGEMNVQGEAVQKLDQKANDNFVRAFEYSGSVRTLISEEMEKPLHVDDQLPAGARRGNYALFFDPLDDSSNVDVNAVVGSIFSVHRVSAHSHTVSDEELLKPGRQQVAAGYVLYGPSTVLVYSRGTGVHQFMLDPGIGEFVLSNDHLTMPARGKVYSINEGNRRKWPQGVQRLIGHLQEKDNAVGRSYSSRYSGCLVADVHRLLSVGGVYLYPSEEGKADGKLRLMYEAAPFAFIIEQAGGSASTGAQRILDVSPSKLHQRVPLIIGSRDDVALAEEFIQGKR